MEENVKTVNMLSKNLTDLIGDPVNEKIVRFINNYFPVPFVRDIEKMFNYNLDILFCNNHYFGKVLEHLQELDGNNGNKN